MTHEEPMASTTRSLEVIWHELLEHPEMWETLKERQSLMETHVQDRILHYALGHDGEHWKNVGEIIEDVKLELINCDGLYSELEIRRLVAQELAYVTEELRKDPVEAFRAGSRSDFWDKYRDEKASPDLMRANLAELMRTVRGWRGVPAVGFGIHELDECFGGIYPGDIAVLTGGPGSMKSSLALNAVEDFILRTEQFCCFYSLDMPRAMIVERLALRECRMSERNFRLALADGMPQAADAMCAVRERYDGRLAIKGHGINKNMTVNSVLFDVAARMPGFVVIDYLTRLKPEGQSDLQFVEPAMNKIHRFAATYQIPFLILSQMSRTSRSDQASGRKGGHSRGGGIVEELAFTEIELEKRHLPEGETFEDDPAPIIATVAKARHGISGRSFFLEKDGPTMSFTGRAIRVREAAKSKKSKLETEDSYFSLLKGAGA